MAVMLVALLTVKLVAAVVPKLTAVAPVRLVPVIVTVFAAGERSGGRGDLRDARRRGVGVFVCGPVALVPPGW